ncbi:MAG: BON domain-containing protein [Vicinamibacterales bacterium]
MKTALIFATPLLVVFAFGPAQLSALSPTTQVVEKTKEGAVKTKDAVVSGSKTVANKTMDGLSKTGEVMTDTWITGRIHAQFVGEDLLKDSDIGVDTSKHVVTLKGTVLTRAGRTRAVKIAKETEGVRRVVNRVTIGPKIKS